LIAAIVLGRRIDRGSPTNQIDSLRARVHRLFPDPNRASDAKYCEWMLCLDGLEMCQRSPAAAKRTIGDFHRKIEHLQNLRQDRAHFVGIDPIYRHVYRHACEEKLFDAVLGRTIVKGLPAELAS
jgi:hypothetical protein